MTAINKLSIYLIKDKYISGARCVKTSVKPINIRGVGNFYIEPSKTKQPSWVTGFFNDNLPQAQIFTASAKGVLLTTIVYRGKQIKFAICFGVGHNLLKPEAVEESFGLKVTLNSVDKGFRSIEKTNIGATSKISREQMSKTTNAAEFGFDVEQDLLRAATGESRFPELGRTVTGGDALHVSVRVDIDSIQPFLGFCYKRYLSRDYKTDFDWIDQIHHIKNPALTEKLDALVIKKFNNEQFNTLWMAIPDLLDWNNLQGFRFYPHQQEPTDDINIQKFREVIGPITELDELTHRYVRAISATSETEFIHWSALKCLYGEVTYYNKQYLINNGKWFWIAHKFVNQVNNYYKKIPLSKTNLLEYNHDNEGAYNEALAASKSQYVLMDEKNLMHGGGKSKIEFCDVFSKDKKMIFVKHYGASSVLSHFFQQGMNSAEYLNADPEFRNKLNKVLPETWQLVNPNRRLNTEQFEIIFAIISRDPKDRPDIPFFSKVSLKNVVRRLKGYRYQVTLKKIASLKIY